MEGRMTWRDFELKVQQIPRLFGVPATVLWKKRNRCHDKMLS